MAQHNNFKKDIDMLSEAYSSVNGKVPATSTTAMPRMRNRFISESSQTPHVNMTEELFEKIDIDASNGMSAPQLIKRYGKDVFDAYLKFGEENGAWDEDWFEGGISEKASYKGGNIEHD